MSLNSYRLARKEAKSGGRERGIAQIITTPAPSAGPRKRWRELDGAADVELAHTGLECGAFHAEKDGSTLGAGDAPLCLLERAEYVLALGLFESGD